MLSTEREQQQLCCPQPWPVSFLSRFVAAENSANKQQASETSRRNHVVAAEIPRVWRFDNHLRQQAERTFVISDATVLITAWLHYAGWAYEVAYSAALQVRSVHIVVDRAVPG